MIPVPRVVRRSANPSEGWRVALLVLATVTYAAAGFMFFERPEKPDLSWADAFWWSLVTMTTVGYGDYFPETPAGRFVVAYPAMLIGLGVLGFGLSRLAMSFIRAEARNRRGFAVVRSSNHVLVCNYSSPDRFKHVLEEIRYQRELRDAEVVLVDEFLEEIPGDLASSGIKYVRGNPSRAETLERANVAEAARAVVLSRDPRAPQSDDFTASVCLTLRHLYPKLHIVAESATPESEEVLKRAGSDSVVCVMNLGPGILARELHDPGMMQVLDELLVWNPGMNNIYFVPLNFSEKRSVEDLRAWSTKSGCAFLGLRTGESIDINPPNDRALERDQLAVIVSKGRPDAIEL